MMSHVWGIRDTLIREPSGQVSGKIREDEPESYGAEPATI